MERLPSGKFRVNGASERIMRRTDDKIVNLENKPMNHNNS